MPSRLTFQRHAPERWAQIDQIGRAIVTVESLSIYGNPAKTGMRSQTYVGRKMVQHMQRFCSAER